MSLVGESFLDGQRIVGMYLGDFAVSGTVRLSRVKYGGGMSHHIDLDNDINCYGVNRNSVMLDETEVIGVL